MSTCFCCSNVLLRHLRGHELYWFCRTCWQEMPVLSEEKCSSHLEGVSRKLPTKRQKLEKRGATVYVSTKQTKAA